MMKKLLFIAMALFAFFPLTVFSTVSPVGKWITVDDKTHKQSGIVEIYEQNGKLFGKIIKDLGVDTIKYCQHCPGDLNNKPVMGLTFLWDFIPAGHNNWIKGKVLDPHDGQVYRASITLSDNGKVLQLRGYWGIFFQTETWARAN